MYKIFDLHNDYYLKLLNNNKKVRYVESQNEAESIVSAIWTSEFNELESFSMLNEAHDFVCSNKKLLFGVEDLHFLNKDNVEKFVKLRPSYAGLTWNTCNALAGGAYESGRLTNFGKHVIKRLEENYIKIDTAHLNEESFMDVASVTTKPLFCSHTDCYSLCENKRNLKDYQIKMIIDSGGLVGLSLVSEFISGSRKSFADDFVSHIDYFACHFGIDNLAIGTDYYGTKFLTKNLDSYSSLSKILSNKLLKLGYTEKAINKIFCNNAGIFMKK